MTETEEIFLLAALAGRFHDKAIERDEPAVIGWDIAAPDGVRRYQMTLVGGECRVAPALGDRPQVLFGIDLADLAELAPGDADWMAMFMAGRLRISGDMAFARALAAAFVTDGHATEGVDHSERS